MPCVLNAADKMAVDGFLKDQVGFLEMSHIMEQCLIKMDYVANPTYKDYVQTDKETRF